MSEINEGDRVRITKGIRWSGVDAGALGTVTEMYDDGSAFVKIDGYTPDNMFGGAIAVGSDQMEKVEDVDFKQGDKVRVVKSFAPQAVRVGDQGVVKELSDDGRFVRVVMDGSNNGYAPFRRDEIELVSTRNFKVGDRVKLVRKTHPSVYVPLGTKGTVIQDTYVDDTYDGRVDFDDEFYQCVKWDQIELIEEKTVQEYIVAEVPDTDHVHDVADLLDDVSVFLRDAAEMKDRQEKLLLRAQELDVEVPLLG